MNLSLDVTYSVVAFNMSPLTGKLQLGFPYRNFIIIITDYHSTHYHNWSLPWDKICSLIFLILSERVFLEVCKLGQWRKKCVIVLVSLPQSHDAFWVSWNQCLNLCRKGDWRLGAILLGVWFHIMNIKNAISTRSHKV